MFRWKPGILILDSNLYDIKYKPILVKIDRKTREKITIFWKYFFEFFLDWAGPDLFGPVNNGALFTIHMQREQWRVN